MLPVNFSTEFRSDHYQYDNAPSLIIVDDGSTSRELPLSSNCGKDKGRLEKAAKILSDASGITGIAANVLASPNTTTLSFNTGKSLAFKSNPTDVAAAFGISVSSNEPEVDQKGFVTYEINSQAPLELSQV